MEAYEQPDFLLVLKKSKTDKQSAQSLTPLQLKNTVGYVIWEPNYSQLQVS